MTQEEFGLRLSRDCAVIPGSRVLAAVSGGADSVALLCFFAQIRESYPLEIACAHVEHGIRAEESRADMAFVESLCQRLNIPFYPACVDAPAHARRCGCGLEDAARELRYASLARIADEIGASAIATAHHAGDQAETVLLHAARGSDIQGLCAMRARSGRLIRPLLGCTAQELRDGLRKAGQSWREDATNADFYYARNRVRGEVLPALERVSPGAGQALCRLARAAQRDEAYFALQLEAMDLGEIALVDGLAVPRERLAGMHPALLSRALVRLMDKAGLGRQNARVIEAVMDALETHKSVVNLGGGAHASAGKRWLCLTRPQAEEIDVPLSVPGMTDTPFGRFEVRAALPGETGDGLRSQAMPARLLSGARVTSRREGDVMTPFGRHTPVKLKKLMIDAGVERAMRRSTPVLRRDDEVLFAVGLRPSQRCTGIADEQRMMVRFLGRWPAGGMEQVNQEDDRDD